MTARGRTTKTPEYDTGRFDESARAILRVAQGRADLEKHAEVVPLHVVWAIARTRGPNAFPAARAAEDLFERCAAWVASTRPPTWSPSWRRSATAT